MMQLLIDTSKPYSIKSLATLKSGGEQMEEMQKNIGCNRQIQNLNHIFPSNQNDDSQNVVFIITNMFQQIQITINNFEEASTEIPSAKDVSFQEFDRK